MNLRGALKFLLITTLGLPVLQTLLVWVAGLLTSIGDETTANVVNQIGRGAGILWLVSITALVVVLAVRSLDDPPPAV
ncbi:hypothetical protein HG15A2_33390 [Adhaeretor mobilis]|uniref:Uncharacterized protein n=2 Tax=Adhaeretor mobilis TaxID=1930276 RepID=A0A517MYT4_9BACT|nr:hypothetical protein HG15A2_33390 [Adhaeretor mobilis]